MSSTWLVLPHQLFPVETHLKRAEFHDCTRICIFEDPAFFGDRVGQPGAEMFTLNKLRIAYQRMLIENFQCELVKAAKPFGFSVTWIQVDELWSLPVSQRYTEIVNGRVFGFDPVDHLFSERLKENGVSMTTDESPLFLLSRQEMEIFISQSGFRDKAKCLLRMSPLLNFLKDKLNILQDQKSLDTLNRHAFPDNAINPPQPYISHSHITELPGKTVEWLLESSPFAKNPGPTGNARELADMLTKLPLNHTDASEWFRKFLCERFQLFGPYEDAIVTGEPWLYHSGISMLLNFGLLDIRDVIQLTREHFAQLTTVEKKKQLPSYEGFIRQLLGWRELCRLYYEYVPMETRRKNVFKLKDKMGPEYYHNWSTSKLPPVVKDAIGDAWNFGYLHHIRRLMIMSNWMTLSSISPDQVFRWMTETTLDTWDWVMHLNVYAMGTWSDGGVSLRKPYISSATYVKKMTNSKGKQTWEDEWTNKFRSFLEDHRDVIKHTELARSLKKQ